MRFNWKIAFAAMAVACALAAFCAAFGCVVDKSYGGAIIAAIVMCGSVFAAAGLFGSKEG